MFDNTSGAGVGCLAVVVLLVLALVVLAAGSLVDKLQNSAAEADRAAASLELARAERERVQSQEWQMRFQVWTAFLASNKGEAELVILAAMGGAATAGALVGGYTLGSKRR